MMNINRILLILTGVISLLLCSNSGIYSQITNAAFERVTSKNGLSQSTVNYIIQDKKGFMWFATYGGLNKYDGYTFKVYQNIDGNINSLSSNGSKFLYEDSEGYIWVVNNASGGLDKFDPVNETFTRYRNNPNDSTTLSSNEVYAVMQDRSGNIWVCTKNALNLVKTEKKGKNTYTSFKRYYNASKSFVRAYENKHGNLLLFADYLYYFDRKTDKIYKTTTWLAITSTIESVCEDKYGNLWIGTNTNGILKLSYNKNTQNYEYAESNKINITPNSRNCVLMDDKERIWIGTENRGLFLYDIKEDRLQNFQTDNTDVTSISDNSIMSLFVDRSGVLWIGTFSQGLCKYNLYGKEFLNYKAVTGNKNTLSGNIITSIHSVVPGELWVGVDIGGGVNRFIFDHDRLQLVKHYKNDPENKENIISNNILCLVQRKNGEVWAGGAYGYVQKIIPEKPEGNNTDVKNICKNNKWTFCIYEDRQGTLWGGTWEMGLWRYDDKTNKFAFYLNNPSDPLSLCDNVIWTIFEDSSGNLWIGGHSQGLSILPATEKNKTTPQFLNFKHEEGKPGSLSNNTIHAIFQDHAGTMWIGTATGLNKVITKADKFRNITHATKLEFHAYHTKDGLPNENIVGILEDNKDDLWLSTSNGLSKFNLTKDFFTNYYESDGLQSSEFGHNAYFKDQNGKMYFGGFNGITAFYPDSIKPNPFLPKVVFTDIKLFNKSVQIGENINGDITLAKSINYISEIILSHKNNVFTIGFAALHYTCPEKNRYSFILEGFEKNWNDVGNKREATYTNLEPGKYIFKVKASNADGIWNEKGAELSITILPPWWRTWLFKILILLIFVSSIYFAYHLRVTLYRKKEKQLSILVKQRTQEISQANDVLLERQTRIEEYAEELRTHTENLQEANELLLDKQKMIETQALQLQEANEQLQGTNEQLSVLNSTKDRFFSIIAHDLRNPFHIVSGFAEILMKDYKKLSPEKIEKFHDLIYTSSTNGKNLLETLLQWSRSQTGRIAYNPTKLNIYTLSEEVINLLQGDAYNKNITIRQFIDPAITVFADENMLKTIIRNLLSNAIKFSHEQGNISLKSAIIDQQVEITVADTGVGIPAENLPRLFRIDATVTTKGTANESGTGLGLILCKEFVEKHNGKIWIESEEGKGSEFKFTLPLG